MYLEGSDQHRGWFQSSLLTSVATEGKAPYHAVLTHGYVVDGEGRKMSKSVGNTVAPQEVIAQYGADIIRLWAASSDYKADIRISKEIRNSSLRFTARSATPFAISWATPTISIMKPIKLNLRICWSWIVGL